MVTGIDSFKEWFKGSEEQYAIIGGTACDILMTEEGLDFRATKDIDLVLIIIYLVAIWGMFRIIYSNYNLIVHANQYLSMNSTVRLVLEIAIHCLVIYQTYVLWIKRQNATDIS